MITRVHSTAVIVSDQDAALEFYVGKLGWKVAIDQMMGDMRFLTVTPGPGMTQIALNPVGMMGAVQPGDPVGIALIADDVDKTFAEFAAMGITITMPAEDMPWGTRGGEFADPDGNRFFVSTD